MERMVKETVFFVSLTGAIVQLEQSLLVLTWQDNSIIKQNRRSIIFINFRRISMQFGSENYQYEDSYFVIVHPFTYVVIGILGLVGIIIFIALKKRKK